MFSFCGITDLSKTFFAYSSTSGLTMAENAVTVSELWNTSAGKFDTANLQILMNYIYPLVKDGNQHSSADIRSRMLSLGYAKDNDNTTGKELAITLGGYTWEVAYISQDDNGNAIATLWMADNTLGSQMWQNNWYSGNTATDWNFMYPANMYATSYIRARLNGGKYAQPYTNADFTTKATGQRSKSNTYFKQYEVLDTINAYRSGNWAGLSDFTTGALADYIVTPRCVSWQNSLSSYLNDSSYNYSSKYTNSNVTQEMYNSWMDDKLWLPSLTETGYSGASDGQWGTSQAMRASGSYSWLRSGRSDYVYFSCRFFPDGDKESYHYVYGSLAVRPALHFNLSSAVQCTAPSVVRWGDSATGENVLAFDIEGANDFVYSGNNCILSASDLTIAYNNNSLVANTDFVVTQDVDAVTADANYYKTRGMKRVLLSGAGDYTDFKDMWLYYSITYQFVDAPSLVQSVFGYTNSRWYVTNASHTDDSTTTNFANYNSSFVSYSGDTSATNFGYFTLTFSLIDSSTCRWKTGGVADITVYWQIGAPVDIPSLIVDYFAYDGTEWNVASGNHSTGTSNLQNFDSEKISYTGHSGTNPSDTYQITFSLIDASSCWEDLTTEPKTITWQIRLSPVTITQNNFTYNGCEWYVDSAGASTGTSNLNNYYSSYDICWHISHSKPGHSRNDNIIKSRYIQLA